MADWISFDFFSVKPIDAISSAADALHGLRALGKREGIGLPDNTPELLDAIAEKLTKAAKSLRKQ